jgi:hypothetical protein
MTQGGLTTFSKRLAAACAIAVLVAANAGTTMAYHQITQHIFLRAMPRYIVLNRFENLRERYLALHQSLLAKAAPRVRAKIAAAAQAAKQYLGRCAQHCDLYRFTARDLRTRFPRLREKELRVMTVLVVAEVMSDDEGAELVTGALQNNLDEMQQSLQEVSAIMSAISETQNAIINCLLRDEC